MSSYAYFGWGAPEDIPLDYYKRLLAGRSLPVMVVEGGWARAGAGAIASSPDKQGRYIARHADLPDQVGAKAWLPLQFADIDVAAVPPPVPANRALFASIGLAHSNFVAKPSLAARDALFARKLTA